jgi:hypothetical protein
MSGVFDFDDDATPLTPRSAKASFPHTSPFAASSTSSNRRILRKLTAGPSRASATSSMNPPCADFIGACSVAYGSGRASTGKTDRNIGIASYRIQPELRQILDDAHYWVAHKSYETDELAVRLHHRLVLVHPFPNGNGRWSRLTADVLVTQFGRPRFTWGSANLQAASEIRSAYIKALHAADEHDLAPLIRFARS